MLTPYTIQENLTAKQDWLQKIQRPTKTGSSNSWSIKLLALHCITRSDKPARLTISKYLLLLLIVFVKINQNHNKHWDGNAVFTGSSGQLARLSGRITSVLYRHYGPLSVGCWWIQKKNLKFSHIFVHLTFKNNAKSTVSFKQISNNLFAPDILELNLVLTGYSPFCKSLHFKDIFFFWKAWAYICWAWAELTLDPLSESQIPRNVPQNSN